MRSAVVAAGPAANFAFAVFAWWVVFMMGVSGLIISESVMPTFGLGNGPDIWEDIHEAAPIF